MHEYDHMHTPHLVFVGRWCPLHRGHIYIIEKKLQECPDRPVLILVRDTSYDTIPAAERAELVRCWMQSADISGLIITIPDIQGVYYGRGVGYDVEQITVPQDVQGISATDIRKRIADGDESWKDLIACPEAAEYLERLLNEQTD